VANQSAHKSSLKGKRLKKCDEIRGRLTLYLDNELQGLERASVETHLAECESCASMLARELNFLKAVRESGPLHVASPELRAKIQRLVIEPQVPAGAVQPRSANRTDVRFRWVVVAAAVLLVLFLPIWIWQFVRQGEAPSAGPPSKFAAMAADNHLRVQRGQLPLETTSTNPQEISKWFTNKVSFSVQLPNYQESSGQEKLYTLEGARLVGFEKDYAAYVAYRMKDRPISLVVTSSSVAKPSGGEEIASKGLRFHYNAIDGLKVLTWSDRGLTYALVSDLGERGQQSCIVCHEGTKDQDFIEPLKPR
jgi:anti-sigma factor RsiW